MTGYEIGSLILTGIGIVATFSAVFVALFQSKLQFKKNIQVEITVQLDKKMYRKQLALDNCLVFR